MTTATQQNGAAMNRATGLLIIEVRHSNPNGDPDAESEPRTIDADGRGLISPVSVKRKLRDLVADKDGPAWDEAKRQLKLGDKADKRILKLNTRRGLDHPTETKTVEAKYNVLETRFRKRKIIEAMQASVFAAEFWDARIFGNTFLEKLAEDGDKKGNSKKGNEEKLKEREQRDHFISTGVVQFGVGVSVAPISVTRATLTNKAGVQGDKVQGMAPLALRVVDHAVYVMPFFVNPCAATKTGCGPKDIELMQFLLPHIYRCTASAIRPFVEIRHAWCFEHKSSLGSCSDSVILDALTPKKVKGDPETPSTSIDEYEIPTKLGEKITEEMGKLEDLCNKDWNEK